MNTIPVTLPDVVDREVTRRAEATGYSKSEVIADILSTWLEGEEQERGTLTTEIPNATTRRALEDAEHGRVNRYTTTDDLYQALGI